MSFSANTSSAKATTLAFDVAFRSAKGRFRGAKGDIYAWLGSHPNGEFSNSSLNAAYS
jgi:hypothetical protein